MVNIPTWQFIVYLVVTLLVSGGAGFFISRKAFMRYLEKNPPVNEKMIRAMFLQMGRKPSEKDIKKVLNSMNAAK